MLFHIIHWECILMPKLIHFKCDKFVKEAKLNIVKARLLV